jgi:hypothetical protein
LVSKLFAGSVQNKSFKKLPAYPRTLTGKFKSQCFYVAYQIVGRHNELELNRLI